MLDALATLRSSAWHRTLGDFAPEVRRVLRRDVLATLLLTVFTALTGPFTGLILRRDLGATAMQFSLLASAGAACLLLSFATARLVDTRRPLRYVVTCGFLARSLFLLAPLAHSPGPLLGVLLAGHLLGAVAGPAQAALLQQLYPRAQRGRALALVRVSGAALGIGLALVAGHVIGWIGWRVVFPLAGLFGMAAALVQRRLPVAPAPGTAPAHRPGLREAWATVRGDAGYRRLLAASFVFGSAIWLVMPATPLLLADRLQVSTGQAGLFGAAAAVTALVANLLWGRLVDRHSSLVALRAIYVAGTLTPLAYYAAYMVRSPWVVVAASVSESLMATGLDLVWMLVVIDFAGHRRAAQYAAIGATLAGVRGILGPLVGGLLVQAHGLPVVYLVAALLMACGALMVSHQIRQIRTGAVSAAEACARAGLLRLQHARQ